MDLKRNKKELVKSRLKQTAASIWGYQDSETESFDPVIDLLFGACASEFEKLSTAIYSSQSRILEKVAQILLPEVSLRPGPAYAVLNGKPLDPEKLSSQTDQFVIEKEYYEKTASKPDQKKIFFSPIPGFKLINAEVSLMATSLEIIRINEVLLKETILSSSSHSIPHINAIWLGLKIDPAVASLKDVSFYFDWFNNPQHDDLLRLLQLSRWFIDGVKVNTKSGVNETIDSRYGSELTDIINVLNINLKMEKKILQFFEDHYITITDDILPEKSFFPEEFRDFFVAEELDKLKEEVRWIKIEFPEIFPVEFLRSTFCTPTAIPVLNRRLHDSNRPYALNKELNIIPIQTEDHFFSIKNIASSNHIKYQEVPFKRVSDFSPGTYTVRAEGVKRFDERNAKELIEYLLEILREEHVAFKSVGSSLIEKELDELQIIINRLRLGIANMKDLQQNTHFLIMRSEIVEDVWLEYWSTTGSLCNNLPVGSALINNEFDNKSLKLITAVTGGKDPPDQLERTAIFRNELLSRNRIVTREDIKAVCFAELGNDIKGIEIARSPLLAKDRNTGFQNCLRVRLKFREGMLPNEMENLTRHMTKVLQQRSSCIYQYRVEVYNDSRKIVKSEA